MRAVANRVGLVLVLAGVLIVLAGLFGAPAIGAAAPTATELPLSDVETLAVDSRGEVYLWLQDYRRVQVYDAHGRFAGGWRAPVLPDAASETQPVLGVDWKDQVQLAFYYASRSRPGTHRAEVYTYSRNHRLVERTEIPSETYDGVYGVPRIFYHTVSDQLYSLDRGLLPRIVRRDPDGSTHVVVVAPLSTLFPSEAGGLLLVGAGIALLSITGGLHIRIGLR